MIKNLYLKYSIIIQVWNSVWYLSNDLSHYFFFKMLCWTVEVMGTFVLIYWQLSQLKYDKINKIHIYIFCKRVYWKLLIPINFKPFILIRRCFSEILASRVSVPLFAIEPCSNSYLINNRIQEFIIFFCIQLFNFKCWYLQFCDL